MVDLERAVIERYRLKYNSINKLNRRLNTLEKKLFDNAVRINTLRRDERTQRKANLYNSRQELVTEKERLESIKEERS